MFFVILIDVSQRRSESFKREMSPVRLRAHCCQGFDRIVELLLGRHVMKIGTFFEQKACRRQNPIPVGPPGAECHFPVITHDSLLFSSHNMYVRMVAVGYSLLASPPFSLGSPP